MEKADFGQSTIDFYGYQFTGEGLKPPPSKMKVIKDCKPLESKTAPRSFLGMVGYLSKSSPEYSSLAATLRRLIHKDTHFKLGHVEEEAFQV